MRLDYSCIAVKHYLHNIHRPSVIVDSGALDNIFFKPERVWMCNIVICLFNVCSCNARIPKRFRQSNPFDMKYLLEISEEVNISIIEHHICMFTVQCNLVVTLTCR